MPVFRLAFLFKIAEFDFIAGSKILQLDQHLLD